MRMKHAQVDARTMFSMGQTWNLQKTHSADAGPHSNEGFTSLRRNSYPKVVRVICPNTSSIQTFLKHLQRAMYIPRSASEMENGGHARRPASNQC